MQTNNYRTKGSCRAESAYPQNHCFNPQFRYVSAANTDIRQTFERVRLELSLGEVREVQRTEIRRQLGWFLK